MSNRILKKYPDISEYSIDSLRWDLRTDSLRRLSSTDFLVRNPHGNWELYVSGNSYEIGNKIGFLTQDLYRQQQKVFMDKVEKIVPSMHKRKFLMRFVHWYSRKLDSYIPEEYLSEIYGLSRYLNDDYTYAGSDYHRTLFLHAAHDIGHALRDLAVVGCSSVASWGDKTEDGKLLIGRNFDFYIGEGFAKNKVVNFIKPDTGIPFMSVSWPGMIGVVSGMNLHGLTVTINAGKSSIPLSAKTPVSLVAREILQYAGTLEEAIAIAKTKKMFVSESLMIGSAVDKKAILIEISPKKIGIYEVQNENQLICTNHFQSKEYANDIRNQEHIRDSHTQYRYDRLQELLQNEDKLNPVKLAAILRNKDGLNDEKIGYGNDRALNHLRAHHAVVFKPEDKLVWVSNSPYQMGAFTAYNLNEIFADHDNGHAWKAIDSLEIPKDSFLLSVDYSDYTKFRIQEEGVREDLGNLEPGLTEEELRNFTQLNPNLWLVYYLSGQYWIKAKRYDLAVVELSKAREMEIPTQQERAQVEKLLAKAIKRYGQ